MDARAAAARASAGATGVGWTNGGSCPPPEEEGESTPTAQQLNDELSAYMARPLAEAQASAAAAADPPPQEVEGVVDTSGDTAPAKRNVSHVANVIAQYTRTHVREDAQAQQLSRRLRGA